MTKKQIQLLQRTLNHFMEYGYKGPLDKALRLTKKEMAAYEQVTKVVYPKLFAALNKIKPVHKATPTKFVPAPPTIRRRPQIEYEECDHCDGVGWHEGGKALKTHCKKCDGTGRVIVKRSSQSLHKYTRLSKKQLERLEQEGGKGQHARFSAKGEVELELIRRVELARRKGPKFILYSNDPGRRVYVADRELVKLPKDAKPLTFNIKEALQFYEGFDDEQIKINYFSNLCGIKFLTAKLYNYEKDSTLHGK